MHKRMRKCNLFGISNCDWIYLRNYPSRSQLCWWEYGPLGYWRAQIGLKTFLENLTRHVQNLVMFGPDVLVRWKEIQRYMHERAYEQTLCGLMDGITLTGYNNTHHLWNESLRKSSFSLNIRIKKLTNLT